MAGLTASGFHWWLEALKFILAVFWAFFIPGNLLLSSKTALSPLTRFTLATLIGLVLWGWQEYLFGWLSLRWLSYVYLLVFLFIWIFKFKNHLLPFFRSLRNHLEIDWLTWLMIFLGVISQTLPLWQNGIFFQDKGFLFTGGNVEDNLWHAALTNQLVKHFPPFAPGLPGVLMKNYHYWSNLVIASLVRVFKLPLFPAQFNFFPLLISFLLGLASLSLAKILNLKKLTTKFLIFFNYFGGGLIYLLLIIFGEGPNFFSMSSLEDGSKFLYNPPRAFSFVIALGGISFFSLWQKKKQAIFLFLSTFLLASTTGFKIYTSLFFAGGFVFFCLTNFWQKNWRQFFIFSSFFILSALIYLPANSRAGGLVWAPFLIVNNFFVQPQLGLERWEMARIIFLKDKKYLHNLAFEGIFTLIFLAAIFGTKILGFLQSPSQVVKKLGKDLFLLFLIGIFSSLIAGLFFIQTTGGANTFNFLISVFLFLSLLASLSIAFWQKKLPGKLFAFFVILIIAFTLPRVIFETQQNVKNLIKQEGFHFIISDEELEIYKLINQDPGNFKVAVDPDHYIGRNSPYASLFTDKTLILSGKGLLKHFGLAVDRLEKTQELIFRNPVEKKFVDALLSNQIKYILLYRNHLLPIEATRLYLSPEIKNESGVLLKVDKEKLIRRYWELTLEN